MRAILYGIPVAALALAIVAKTVRADIVAGEPVPVGLVCKTKQPAVEIAEHFTKKEYKEAQARFETFAVAGECTMAPNGAQGLASYTEKVGEPYVDEDGDTVQGYIAQVGGYWVLVAEVLVRGGKS